MNRRGFAFGSLAAGGLALAGCQTASREAGQPLGASLQPGYRPERSQTEAGLWQIADKIEQDVKTSPYRVKDPALETYVKDLACRLSDNYCRDIRVYVLRTPHFNATMAPNGCMQIWSGLLLRAENEAQFAAIVGHEIGHYLRRHSLQRFEALRSSADFAVLLGLGLGVAGLGLLGDVASLMIIAGNQAYSRDHEREADEMGLDLVAQVGLAPGEASKVWQQVIAEEEAAETKRQRDFLFASHPAPQERMDSLIQMADAKIAPPSGWQTGVDRYQEILRPHRRWMLNDEVRLRRPGPSLTLLDRMLSSAPEDGELYYYRGEVFRLREREGDLELALEQYEQALAKSGAPAEVYRARGLVQMKKGDRTAADGSFRAYLERRPDAEDRLIIRSYLSTGA